MVPAMCWLKFAALNLFLSATTSLGQSYGLPTCPCLEWAGLDHHVDGGHIIYEPLGSAGNWYEWPADYGNGECQAHDLNLEPMCSSTTSPSWCRDQWCWVDPDNCQGASLVRSVLFPDVQELYFSYQTCGSTDTFSAWAAGNSALGTVNAVMTSYLDSSRLQIEASFQEAAGSFFEECIWQDQCRCTGCKRNNAWNQPINAAEVGTWLQPAAGTAGKRLASCMAKAVGDTYRRAAAKESNAATSRVGYQYYADQASGSLIQWPLVDWCPEADYDPRFRPWYASGASGPKDIVIVVDVSGSMTTEDRHEKAKKATEAILNTLVWKDFATIILFNHQVAEIYSNLLVPVTNTNRDLMIQWIERQEWKLGGTNFKKPIEAVFEIIKNSVAAGQTSTCQRAVMFLTDGAADFTEADFQLVKQQASEWDAIFLTYALGSGADSQVTKRLACDNRGIFYPVDDNADLTEVMAAYYEYFAAGQASCLPSYSRYSDKNTGSVLYASCMAMHDRHASNSTLLGVTCMDVNMLASIDKLEAQAGTAWDKQVCEMSDVTKKCRHMQLTGCHLQKLRHKVSEQSVCGSIANFRRLQDKSCPCLDRNCKDDDVFIDEQGYFCDAWIGDDCRKAVQKFGYSPAGQAQVVQKCRRSCGLCQLKDPCPYTDVEECSSTMPRSSSCRACFGKVSGVTIDGRAECCPDRTGAHALQCSDAPVVPPPSQEEMVTGTVTLQVSDPARFSTDMVAKQAAARGIAQTLGVPESNVEIISASQVNRLLRELPRRLASGKVMLTYRIRTTSAQAASVRAAMETAKTGGSLENNIITSVHQVLGTSAYIFDTTNTGQTNPVPTEPTGDGSGGSGGIIIGVIAGGGAAVVVLIAVVVWCVCRSRTRTSTSSVTAASIPKPTPIPPAAAAAAGAPAAAAPKPSAVPSAERLAVPTSWKNQDHTKDFFSLEAAPELLVHVQNMLDTTWKEVKTQDRTDGSEPKLMTATSVLRVENNILWQRYAAEVKRIKGKRSHRCTAIDRLRGGSPLTVSSAAGGMKLTGKLDYTVNETVLWHGTSPEGAMGITKDGFDLGRVGSAANAAGRGCRSMYGPGVYMAEASSKSDEYARDDQGGLYAGQYCLLICRTVLGEPMCLTAGGDSVHAMIKAAMDGGAYDSVIGDREVSVGTYREFVIYREEQVYPEFIVLYKRAD